MASVWVAPGAVQYDEQGAVIGLELINVRFTLEREGRGDVAAGRTAVAVCFQ